MRPETIKLFPNFTGAIQKMKRVKNFQLMEVKEVTEQDIYVNYITHVNSINGFKDEMATTTLIDDVAELVPAGETLVVTRNCIGDINKVWNICESCYFDMRDNHTHLSNRAENIDETLEGSIESLDTLCEDPNDKYAKSDLNQAVKYMEKYLNDSIGYTKKIITEVQDFHDTSYDKQYEDFDKIIAQLSKESTTQEEERDAITSRIKQLERDISAYNASIAALAVSMGVSCFMITGSFFISGGFGIVISLFLLPAVAVATAELVSIVKKLEAVKKEIAGYGDYENEYNNVIKKLDDLKGTTKKAKDKSEAIKEELDGVNAPWKALHADIEQINKIIMESSFDNYEEMRDAFKEVKNEWDELRKNLEYLDLDASVSKVVHLDEVVADVDFLLTKARGEGISMSEFMVA